MNHFNTKKHGRPPPEVLAVGPRARKTVLAASRLAREYEKSSGQSRGWPASKKNRFDSFAVGPRMRKIALTASRLAREQEKSSWQSRGWPASITK